MDVTTLAVRPMTADDIDGVLVVETAAFEVPWERSAFEEELATPRRHYLVGEVEGRVVSYGGLMLIGEDAHIMTFAVHPDHRRKGIGTLTMLRLVESAIERGAEHLTLEVRPSNGDARRIYARFGFRPVGLRPRYYRDEDALVMWAIDITEPAYQVRLDRVREALS